MSRRFTRWVLLVGIGTLLLIAASILSGGIGIQERRRGEVCVRCGAHRTKNSSALKLYGGKFEFANEEQTKPSKLTDSWKSFSKECNHDWAFWFVNNRLGIGKFTVEKSYGDGFPRFRYPAASNPD